MRALLVSQYYAPEIGATQNRMSSFADGLRARGHDVAVICEQPNHPSGVFQPGYGRRPLAVERGTRGSTYRLWVAASPHKTTARRLAFYGTFAAGALAVGLAQRADVVFATSPPLPGALAAGLAATARRTPFVLDVRDIWPAAAEAVGEVASPAMLRRLERIERWLYRRSVAVTATTRPFCTHIDEVAGERRSVLVPNGALDELFELPAVPPPDGPFTLGYVGNLGIAQGLGIVLDAADRLREDAVRFVVVGDGPLRADFSAERDRRGLESVEIRPQVPTTELGALLQSCHALLVPLRAHSLLEDFIPSKLYDAMAVGRAAIVAAGGEGAALTSRAGCGLVIPPEDGDALAAAVRELAASPEHAARLGEAGRLAAAGYARSTQVERLEQVLGAAAAGQDAPRAVPDELGSG